MSSPARRYRPARVLIVDDSLGDATLIREAFADSANPVECRVAADGVEALEALADAADAHGLPDLMVVDLNMPRMDGIEVLKAVRSSTAWRHVPVVIMTSSSAKEDILSAYANHASSYVEKPAKPDELFGVVQDLEQYWLVLAELPEV